ncbi:MBL fold metallo-hydrolase [Cellulomonas sp. H30R-01]|uniref:MBL fold metallo-hydrolase n=1 Tax=Cellulomonas sp. H30R-01 TaxID=2704467 RepID=UPI00138C284A|nr:MBL fold metallo-hydrolase [Cellulomonas sp. H30R-01]QHT56045.1 MBL fold metallo-hydrolase [Cellulomonas sp. H30R-01]
MGDDGTTLVVDPGVTAAEVAGLGAAVARRGWRPVAVWSTHAHWDHVLDGHGVRGLPRWRAGGPAADDDAGWARSRSDERDDDVALAAVLAAHPQDAPADVVPVRPEPYPHAAGTDRLDWRGPEVAVVAHAAHAPDHGALVVVRTGVLLCGDMLSDREVPLLDDTAADPVGDYRAGLDALAGAVERFDVSVVVPGHGSPGDRDELDRRLDADRAYLDALADGRSDDPRLADPWVADAHAVQLAALRR